MIGEPLHAPTPAEETALEVTERTLAEEALVKALAEAERINHELSFQKFALDQYPIVAITDRAGRITYVNDRFCEISGYSREDLLGRDHRIVNSAFHEKAFFTDLHASISKGRVWRGDICNRAKDGRIYWVDTTIVPLQDETGRVMRYVAIRAEITKRKLAEEALRASEGRYRTLFEYAPDGIVIADPKNFYVDANPSVCRLLGYTRDELIGLHASNIVAESELQHIAPALNVIHAMSDSKREWQFRRKDGSVFAAEVIATMTPDGNFMGMIRDITAHKLVEAEIERVHVQLTGQNHRLAALTEQAHRFVDDVSHEFRTPLAVIKEFGAIIADGLAGPIMPEQAQYLGIIDNAVLDLNQMVEDFLDSSKLRAGRLRVDRRPQKVADMFARIRPGLLKKAASRSITVVECIDPDLPLVFADEEKARRVIMNLATNAVKFSPEGSRIELWARQPPEGGVEIGVTDQGHGLPPGDLKQLFERFRQLPNSDVPSVKGFGLGLNIARQLVWLNLGRMNVVSEVGHGSTFSFTLPADDRRMILNRFFARLEECEEVTPSVAVISVRPEGAEPQDDLRLFLAATTRPTDVILDMTCSTGKGLLVLGPTQSADGWAARLSRTRKRAVAEAGAATLGNIRIEILGTFAHPAAASAATACALEHLTQEYACA